MQGASVVLQSELLGWLNGFICVTCAGRFLDVPLIQYQVCCQRTLKKWSNVAQVFVFVMEGTNVCYGRNQ